MSRKQWNALLRFLRDTFPVSMPVKVVRKHRKVLAGWTRFDGGAFTVLVNSSQSEGGQRDTIMHEWGHVRCIDRAYQHDSVWGAEYSAIFSAWEIWEGVA